MKHCSWSDGTTELVEHLLQLQFSAESNNGANIKLEVVDNLAGAEAAELERVLDVLHVAGDHLVPGHTTRPLQLVIRLGNKISPLRL